MSSKSTKSIDYGFAIFIPLVKHAEGLQYNLIASRVLKVGPSNRYSQTRQCKCELVPPIFCVAGHQFSTPDYNFGTYTGYEVFSRFTKLYLAGENTFPAHG